MPHSVSSGIWRAKYTINFEKGVSFGEKNAVHRYFPPGAVVSIRCTAFEKCIVRQSGSYSKQ